MSMVTVADLVTLYIQNSGFGKALKINKQTRVGKEGLI